MGRELLLLQGGAARRGFRADVQGDLSVEPGAAGGADGGAGERAGVSGLILDAMQPQW